MASKQNDVIKWEDRVDVAKDLREEREDDWKENINWYQGFQHGDAGEEQQDTSVNQPNQVTMNILRSNVQRIIPAIYFRDPKVLVAPKREQDKDRAPLVESVLNYTIPQIGLKNQIKRAITDAQFCTFGVIKIGYDSEFKINEEGDESEQNIDATPGFVWNLRVSPFDLYLDPTARNLDGSDAEYIMQRIIRPLKDVKADKYYENTGNLTANMEFGPRRTEDLLDSQIEAIRKSNREMVEYWEIWDRRKQEVVLMAPGHDRLLKKVPWPWVMDGFPFETITFNYATDQLYPRNDIENYKSLQDVLNKTLTIIQEHTLRSLPKLGVTKNVQPDVISQLKNPVVDAVIKGFQSSNDIFSIPHAQINPDSYNFLAMIRDGINIGSSVNELQRGGIPRGAKTATAAALLERNANVRQDEWVDTVQDMLRNILRKDLQLMQQEYDEEKVIRIAGNQQGVFEFRKFTKEEIKGEFDIEIEPFSATPRNRQQERQDELTLANLTLNPTVAQQAGVNAVETIKDVYKAFEKKNIDKLIPAQEAVEAQESKDPAIENLLLTTGADVEVSPNDDDQAHMQVHLEGRASVEAAGVDPQIVQGFDKHIQSHRNNIIQKIQRAQQGGQPGQPGIAPGGNLSAVPGLGGRPNAQIGNVFQPGAPESFPVNEDEFNAQGGGIF